MWETSASLGQLITILIMALALGLDAFSLSVGIGMKGIRLLHIFRISLWVGVFHVIMPLLGIVIGQYVSLLLGTIAGYVAGGLLILLGGHMVVNAFHGSMTKIVDYRSWIGISIFSLSVSVDSFSVGVSLGMFNSNVLITVLAFGMCGALMSVLGLLLGRKVGHNLGEYGEALGGAILLAFGLLFIF
ncbi:putative Mn2+ efflux pump MntP [Paenibacillus sp. DS2015]|uniref:manganese efflux pump MntP n=1 Tax=Paenibacillus sp. DS2015 TaxID=3373917 RepID=UPI003D1EAC47